MKPLLDHHLVPFAEIIQTSRHRSVPPVDRTLSFGVRFRLIDGVRIVHYYIVAALPGPGRHRNDDAIPGRAVLKAVLLVLISCKLKAISPALLIPRRLDQSAAFETVPG